MKPLLALIKKELKSYIDHPTAYILVVVFIVLNNFLFFRTSMIQEVASLRAMFNLMPWVMMFFVSALTMKTWAEEKKEGTLLVLLSYPVKIWQLVVGKYLATVIFVSAMLLLTLIAPLSLTMAGDFDWGVIFGQYFGSFVMILAMVAVGQWASSLTKNQVVSFIISIAVLFIFFLIGLEFVILSMPFPLNTIAQQLGLLSHFTSLTRGVIDARDILYFLSMSFVFLMLSYAWLMRYKIAKTSKARRTMQSSVIVLIVIAVVINLFGQSFTVRADLTKQNLYSLSSATKQVLKDLDDTVRLTLYRSKKLPTQIELVSRDVQDILRDYQKIGGRRVDLSVKYPDEDEEIAKEAQSKGIPPVRFNVVRESEFTLLEGYFGLAIEYLDEQEAIPLIHSISDIEYRLTRAILAMQSDEKKTLGYLSDFGGKPQEELAAFVAALKENYTVQIVELGEKVEESIDGDEPALEESGDEEPKEVKIDEEIDVLFIAGPTMQFSDAAIDAVKQYIQNGGKIFWLVSGININQAAMQVTSNETGLEEILKEQGIALNTDLVADLASHETVNFSAGIFTYLLPYPFWVRAGLEQHVLAGNLQQVVLPWSGSLTISDDAGDNVSALIKTTESGVKQSGNYSINPEQLPDFASFKKEFITLGATVQDVPADEGQDSGRWVIISNAGFLDDGMVTQHPGNGALGLNAFDWLVQNEVLLTIRSKDSKPNALIWKSDVWQVVVKWGNIAGIPVLVALFGGVWIWRRRRKSRR